MTTYQVWKQNFKNGDVEKVAQDIPNRDEAEKIFAATENSDPESVIVKLLAKGRTLYAIDQK